jgi:hypothetical protein
VNPARIWAPRFGKLPGHQARLAPRSPSEGVISSQTIRDGLIRTGIEAAEEEIRQGRTLNRAALNARHDRGSNSTGVAEAAAAIVTIE